MQRALSSLAPLGAFPSRVSTGCGRFQEPRFQTGRVILRDFFKVSTNRHGAFLLSDVFLWGIRFGQPQQDIPRRPVAIQEDSKTTCLKGRNAAYSAGPRAFFVLIVVTLLFYGRDWVPGTGRPRPSAMHGAFLSVSAPCPVRWLRDSWFPRYRRAGCRARCDRLRKTR